MTERKRLELLSVRDGLDVARQWALSTANLYQQSIDTAAHFASRSEWRPRYVQVICELTIFSQTGIFQDMARGNGELIDDGQADADA